MRLEREMASAPMDDTEPVTKVDEREDLKQDCSGVLPPGLF